MKLMSGANSASLTGCFLLSLALVLLPNHVRADALTGTPYDDTKEMGAAPTSVTSTQSANLFLPMPGWARGNVMPPLPDKLKPMGRGTGVTAGTASKTATTPTATASLAPPKDTTITAGPTKEETPAPSKPAPAPFESNPALVTVSPFLQWIKANPQAAATQARQEAGNYNNPPNAPVPAAPGSGHSAATINGQPAPTGSADPYWLPPLIDSPDIAPTVVGGSAAIYSTPQR